MIPEDDFLEALAEEYEKGVADERARLNALIRRLQAAIREMDEYWGRSTYGPPRSDEELIEETEALQEGDLDDPS